MTMIDKAEALLPCPFCGSTMQVAMRDAMLCLECYAAGPQDEDRKTAWNRRALPARGVGVKDFDVEIVRGNTGGNLSLYFNDHRVAGSKPWGGGTTIHSFRVQGDEVKSSGIFATIRNVQTVPADKDFLTTAALAPTDAPHVNETQNSEHDAGNVLTDAAQSRAPFFFDRYINGVRMAEDVCIERETTLEGAMQAAARIAAKGPNGEAPVLVYRAPAAQAREAALRTLIYAAKAVLHDLHHGNGLEGLYENRDRLEAAIRAMEGR